MIERHEIENVLLGEIAEHFTSCGEDQGSYAGVLVETARQQQGSVVLIGYDRASRTPFAATARVQVLVEPAEPGPTPNPADKKHHSGGSRGSEPEQG